VFPVDSARKPACNARRGRATASLPFGCEGVRRASGRAPRVSSGAKPGMTFVDQFIDRDLTEEVNTPSADRIDVFMGQVVRAILRAS
jgi:hypothetical protein